MAQSEDQTRMKFMRITLLGSTACGKTCLAYAFVNNHCPSRHVPTEQAGVFHKKLEVIDEGEYEEVRKPILVEVEDTPGSEKGMSDGGDDLGGGPPRIKKGARVTVVAERSELVRAFKDPKYKALYKPLMDGMCGKDYTVKTVNTDDTVALPSPDGSEGGYWNFAPKAVKLKTSMETPIDQFLVMGERPEPVFTGQSGHTLKKQWREDRLLPMKSDPRTVGPAGQDHSYTKNRMGYFLCFDLSDEDGTSLKEAMTVSGMLEKALAKRKSQTLSPVIWLIGCKSDMSGKHAFIRMNEASALAFSEEKEIPYRKTSARLNDGVSEVFQEMIQAISSKPTLWSMESDDKTGEEDEQAGCMENVM